jgi:hypothetical protein
MTIAEFLESQPEFTGAEDTLIQAKIDEATRRRRSEVWGDLQEDGIRLLTCRLLALSPYGRAMKMVSKDGTTVYDEENTRLCRVVAVGHGRLAGTP